MDHEAIERRVREITMHELAVPLERVLPTSRIVEDLDADSLDHINFMVELQKEFSFTICDEDLEKLVRVSDIVAYIEAQCGRGGPQSEEAPAA